MMILKFTNILIAVLLFFGSFLSLNAQKVEVHIHDIRSSKGVIIVGIYTNDENFKDDNTFQRLKFQKTEMRDGKLIVNLNLPAGTYGLSLLDDENNDNDMNYNLVGIPKEGFGFSNYYHETLKRPRFELFSFTVTENEKQKVTVKFRYIL